MEKPTRPRRKPRRRLKAVVIEQAVLTLIAAMSLAWSGWWLWSMARTPAFAPFVERAHSELSAAYERGLAREATPNAVIARLDARLDEEPRDWVVIDALTDLAEGQGIVLPDALRTRIAALDAEDNGWIATGLSCAACAWDLRQCELTVALSCGVAVNLTVLGDLVALTREGGHYLAGAEVDQVDVALSFVGLAATGLVVMSGGTSLAVKSGAAVMRVAHRTGRLAPDILAVFRRGFAAGIDWARLPAVRGAEDLAGLARPRVLRPAIEAASDLGRLNARLGSRQALHLVGALDTPAELRAAARAAEALGPRTVGGMELLGKSRFLRLGLRLADEVWAVIAGVIAALASGAALLAPLAGRLARGTIRPLVRLGVRLFLR
jgi:hypothetical protein